MAVKIRLKRMGSKKRPFYRVVVADSRKPVSGGIIDTVGTYNPISEPKEVEIDNELALQWMRDGAKPSDSVRKLFSDRGLMEQLHNEKVENRKNN
jgi:small subunit ribosomal protein S16